MTAEELTSKINYKLRFIQPVIPYANIKDREYIERSVKNTITSFKEVCNFSMKQIKDNNYSVTKFKWNYTDHDGDYGCRIVWKNV